MSWFNDLNWDILLSGLIGAVVGGVASVVGGIIAARSNISAQRHVFEKQEEAAQFKENEQRKLSSKILYAEIITSIAEGLRVNKNGSKGLAVSGSYHEHFKNVIQSLTPSEVSTLYKVYGHIERLRIIFVNYDYNNVHNNLSSGTRSFLNEIFGENLPGTLAMDPNNINNEHVILNMRYDYQELAKK